MPDEETTQERNERIRKEMEDQVNASFVGDDIFSEKRDLLGFLSKSVRRSMGLQICFDIIKVLVILLGTVLLVLGFLKLSETLYIFFQKNFS